MTVHHTNRQAGLMRGVGLRAQAEFLYVPQFREQDEPWLLAPEEPLGPAVQRALVYQAQQEVKALAFTHGVCLRRSRRCPAVFAASEAADRGDDPRRGGVQRGAHTAGHGAHLEHAGDGLPHGRPLRRGAHPPKFPRTFIPKEFGLRS